MTRNRWAVAAAGTLAMICPGTVYAWSIFTQPLLAAFGWYNTTTTWTFALAIFFLGVGAVVGGRWQDRSGPRVVAVTGALVWGLGNLLAGLFTQQFGAWWIFLTYGLVGGLGLGLCYITPVSAVTKWFPDRRGLGGGMVVMGFGLGAFFYSNIMKLVPSFAAASRQAANLIAARAHAEAAGAPLDPTRYLMAPEHVSAVMNAFVVSGIVFAVLGGFCASFLRNPPPGYERPGAAAAAAATARDFTPSQALRTPQFWSLWTMLFLNVTAGILFISNAVPIMRELTGVPPETALSIYGTIALFNGLGRFFWGAVSDRIGRNMTYILIYGSQVMIFMALGVIHAVWLAVVLLAIVLLGFGGGFGTMPSFTADYFGTRYYGVIYGWILVAWGIGATVGPTFVAFVKDRTGNYAGALPYIGFMLIAATFLPVVTRPPEQPAAPPTRRAEAR